MNILGISAYYHDSAAALVRDGEIVAAAQEERFTRIKHDFNFPENAVEFCMQYAGIDFTDLEYVVFYDKPLLKFDRLIETYLAFAPKGFHSFSKAMPLWLKQKMHTKRDIKKRLGKQFNGKIIFLEHHESHASSAFFPSPFEKAAIVTIDGVGEWATASIGCGRENKIELLHELKFPHSLGLLYSAFTYYTGFKVNSGEYKLMGLAPYGNPRFVDIIKEKLVDIKDDGSIWMDMSYFNYCHGSTMTSEKFHKLFGRKARKSETNITQFEMDIAASIQVVTEEVMLKMVRHAREVTGCKNLCLAGGVALNCVGNGKIIEENIFDNIWIQPAAGDAGGALGAALFVHYQLLCNRREVNPEDSQNGSLLGPLFSCESIKESINNHGLKFEYIESDKQLCETVGDLVANEKVVGWYSGRMEFGPRALGSRSIIGDARSEKMQAIMNMKIKYRESFRPFAPSVLSEDVTDYFDFKGESPYMLIVAKIKDDIKKDISDEQKKIMREDPDLMKRVNVPRSTIPAITHIDYSARLQTIDKRRHGKYYRMIKHFKDKTGCSVIINTSFNIRGEPIVCTPDDAIRCFMNTEMDILVLENYILRKSDQNTFDDAEQEKYRKQFKLD